MALVCTGVGTDNAVSATGLTGLDVTTAFSWAGWIRQYLTTASASQFYEHWNDSTSLEGVRVRAKEGGIDLIVADASTTSTLSLNPSLGRTHYPCSNTANLTQHQNWFHYLVTWDGARAIFYVNGIPRVFGALSKTATTGGTRTTHGLYSAQMMTVADMRVWDRFINYGEVQGIVLGRNTGDEKGIWGRKYKVDGASAIVRDESGNGNNLTGNSTAARWTGMWANPPHLEAGAGIGTRYPSRVLRFPSQMDFIIPSRKGAVTAIAPATKLVVTAQPAATTIVGQTMANMTVTAQNASNIVDTAYTTNCVLGWGTNPGSAPAPAGTTTKAMVAGSVTFNDIVVSTLQDNATFTFTSGSLTSATSSTFDIVIGGGGVHGLFGGELVT
jgi:hypothetical protein